MKGISIAQDSCEYVYRGLEVIRVKDSERLVKLNPNAREVVTQTIDSKE